MRVYIWAHHWKADACLSTPLDCTVGVYVSSFCLWTMHTILNPWYMYSHWIYTTSTMCNLVHVYLPLGSAVSRWGTAIGWRGQGFYTLPKTSATFSWYTLHLLFITWAYSEWSLPYSIVLIHLLLSLSHSNRLIYCHFLSGAGAQIPPCAKIPGTADSRKKHRKEAHFSY